MAEEQLSKPQAWRAGAAWSSPQAAGAASGGESEAATFNISLDTIRLYGFHGNSAEEQQVGSWFEVDLTVEAAVSAAAFEGDDLSGTIDYASALAIVQTEFATPARLLEHLAWRTARAVLRAFPIAQSVGITVRKLAPPMRGNVRAAAVSTTVRRDS